MATQFPDGRATGMADRIKRLLLAPKEEWPRIDAEPMTTRGLFVGWVVPLAAIGPIALVIGGMIFGYGFWHPPLGFFVTLAVMTYVMSLVGTFALALIVDALAPSFGAAKSPVAALKVAAFSYTAAWLAGIFNLVPALGILGIVGLYSLYLLWLGLPLLMKAPADKALPYFAVTLVVGVIVMIVVQAIAGGLSTRLYRQAFVYGADAGTVTIPGMGSVDPAKLNAAAARMDLASRQMRAEAASGKSSAVPVADLQAMLPASIAGFTRGDIETQSGAAAGIGGAKAAARYTQGEQSFRLSVADIGAMGAIATLGGAVNAQSSKTTATGYEKSEMVGGAMIDEKWDNQDHSGRYSTVVASRFTIDASGSAPSIDVLKGAVGSVDTARLQALVK